MVVAKCVSLFVCVVVLSACASVRLTEGDGKTHQYFGYVAVTMPIAQKHIEAVKLQSFGIALENGIAIGWRDKEMVLVPLRVPADAEMPYEATCSVVVIVRSGKQAQHAVKTLSNIEGEQICVTSFQ